MWIRQIFLAVIGLSSGALVAGGLFGFIVSLGIISDFADKTHTAHKILLYETAILCGGILGNIFYVYQASYVYLKRYIIVIDYTLSIMYN